MSDIVIINEAKLIYNSSLEIMKSCATYITELQQHNNEGVRNKEKKLLYFRVSDCRLADGKLSELVD